MKRQELQELFCAKITLEYKRFEQKIIKDGAEEAYKAAYKIDCTSNIYQLLIKQSQQMNEQALKSLLVFPNLLAFFFREWLHTEDSFSDELEECITDTIGRMLGKQSEETEFDSKEEVTAA